MSSIAWRRDGTDSPAPLDGLADAPTALLADAHRAVIAIGEPLRSLGGRASFVGEALTIHDGSLAQWKALDIAHAGQVLVIAADGRRDRSEFGAIYATLAARKCIAAIVTDGLLRDRDEIARLDIAVFACGSHPSSPADPQQGRIGFPEEIVGVRIATGDIVVGDADGLAIIPRASLQDVLGRLDSQRLKESSLEAGASGPEAGLPPRILEAVRAVPIVERADA
jgi:4-hydroxy-4-methyl-2-oxoglutarate aldolase